MNFYVVGQDPEDVRKFFSVLAEEDRPRIVSDKDKPAVWDHPSDDPTIIVTDEPRLDADATELSLEGRQADEVLAEIDPKDVQSEDPLLSTPEADEAEEPVKGPLTYADRGFKVGRIS